ncbi:MULTISPECIES: branched-chain amino acid ABC transporter permease [unclassified Micromonospora]|uniref:branched-chain amino acid ABC transporter permease n=1 Tax=unclassified Micromonospora TaxID=2617518 RepID=UPI001B38707D|nr:MULTISPECIES: branched-chain amino acid ABC transporter permease [unclassified Micromonospora]MBQ1041023.1 branched-chain amino acid ABC transporter permease [Micromonospora sp. C72]MBQ1055176.1 branched-chain amino acid ABC transporter permease [Micromonospora sp. C32]
MTVIQLLVNSLTLGAIYALVALGLVLVFKSSDLVNFGAGDWVLAGAYIALALLTAGLPLYLVLILAPLGGALMGLIIDRAVFRRIMSASPWTFVVASLAVGGLLRELAVLRYQSNHFPFPPVLSRDPVEVLGVRITPQNLWVLGATVVVVIALLLFFRYTTYGRALEAVAQNRVGAQIVGINLSRALMVTWALAGAVSAVAAVLIAPSTDVSPEIGLLLVKGFVAAALGGLDSLEGAVMGGVAVAAIETFTQVYLNQAAVDVVVYGLLLVVMWVRPAGLLGRRVVRRV